MKHSIIKPGRPLASLLAASLLPLALGACVSMAPKYQRPAAPVPQSFPQGPAYAPNQAADTAVASIGWRAFFKDTRLQQVIARALTDSRSLRQSLAGIEAAHAQYRVTRANSLPQISASVSGTGARSVLSIPGYANSAYEYKDYTASIGFSNWELDLFGKQRSLNRAAFESYLATAEGARATRISLIAETASAWLAYGADRSQLTIAEQTLASTQHSRDVTRQRLASGVASRVDVSEADTLYQTARNDVATLTTQVAQDRNALDLLVGSPVEESLLPTELPPDGWLADVPAGVSSSVLLERPDVQQAEHTLKADNADIGAARAAFFPDLSLTASGGLESAALSTLFKTGTNVWSIAPQVAMPLFSGGANIANLAYYKAERKQAVAAYEQAVQSAFREVADALAVRGTLKEQLDAQQALVTAAQDSYRLADARYEKGVDTYLNALDSQRTLYTAQRNLVTTRQTGLDNAITLYRALGGGLVEQ